MSKTLVIILSETRAQELTFNNFKKNVIDELNADLCLCIGVKSDYDYNNPFYNLAKYKFLYDETDDFGDAFDYAYNILSKDLPKYEKIENVNFLHGKINDPQKTTDSITYYGTNDNIINTLVSSDEEIVVHHTKNFNKEFWKNQIYGSNEKLSKNFVKEDNVITYKKPIHWREFTQLPFHGWGVKGSIMEKPVSSGILVFFRWFLLKNLIEQGLIDKYDRFIITRSDYIYQLPHPKVEYMNDRNIWIPDSEHYSGYTDRHAVLSRKNIVQYLNIFNNFVFRSNEYFYALKNIQSWPNYVNNFPYIHSGTFNLEQLIVFHLKQNNVFHLVQEFPYVMHTVRNLDGKSNFSAWEFLHEDGYYVKYPSEYNKATDYKKEFENSGLTIDEFYKRKMHFYETLSDVYLNWNTHVDRVPFKVIYK
jgi:hypothetical protein